MIRKALVVAGALALQFSIPADYSVCNIISPGPITPQTPQQPFKRQPDDAALTQYPRTYIFDGMPPERMRGRAIVIVSTGSVAECGTPAPGTYFEACDNNHVIHMTNPCDFPKQEYARLLCHEIAHERWGWPADHGA